MIPRMSEAKIDTSVDLCANIKSALDKSKLELDEKIVAIAMILASTIFEEEQKGTKDIKETCVIDSMRDHVVSFLKVDRSSQL